MNRTKRAILVLGGATPSSEVLERAASYGEVFVLARAVPVPGSRLVVDVDAAEAGAGRRLREVTTHLKRRGSRSTGVIGAADRRAASQDARALFPGAAELLEAA